MRGDHSPDGLGCVCVWGGGGGGRVSVCAQSGVPADSGTSG